MLERVKSALVGLGAGWVLLLMFALSVISVAIMLERGWLFISLRDDIPKLMRDMGQGITAFKRGMKEDKDKVEADATSPGVSPSVTHQDKAAG